jgi:dihydrolipoamide dehydrogenase
MDAHDVDVVVVGAGGGGYPAAFLLDKAGCQVVMVDPIGNLGGDCLAEGCVPSKAVREASLMRARARRQGVFGLHGRAPEIDWPGVLAHKDHVQSTRYSEHRAELAGSTIRFHTGHARVVSENSVEVAETSGAAVRYRFSDLVLATGSAPSRLAIPGAELAVTSHDLFRLGADIAFPAHPVIIGGGYIGVEVASMLENLGASPLILEATPEVLPGFDAELTERLHRALGGRVEIRTGAFVTAIERSGSGYLVRYHVGADDAVATGDVVVMAPAATWCCPKGSSSSVSIRLHPRRSTANCGPPTPMSTRLATRTRRACSFTPRCVRAW